MTAGDIVLLALGVLIGALALWAMRPRPRPRPGPHNNWRQRSGAEVESGKTRAEGLEDAPHSIGYGAEGTEGRAEWLVRRSSAR